MNPERWAEVERVYHAAAARPASERTAILAKMCAGDEALRREVESLLAQSDSAAAFLDQEAVAVAAQLVSDPGGSALIGQRLGTYQLQARIGVGGMGEVYRARDTKLGRDVAIKILPRHFTSDRDRVARFEREARLLASLNHPNVATIHGFEEHDGSAALVMELIEGETLAERIARGALPLTEALPIARQIAEALDAAHERGIVHRDLKPANIKITPAGVVKVLDFGLAKAAGNDATRGPEVSPSPAMTQAGIILGTAAYMSPEQAKGHEVDKRSDVWAFGAVLYEMITGRPAFVGDDVSDTLARILMKEPDWTVLTETVPSTVVAVIRRCLQKDRTQRVRDIGDVLLALGGAFETIASGERMTVTRAHRVSRRAWIAASVLTCAIAGLAFMAGRWLNNRTSDDTMLWASILPPEKPFNRVVPAPALSPDGRYLAFNAPNREGRNFIWVRPLDSPAARALPGTEGSNELFWSPDGRSLGFFAKGKLWRTDIAGGAPQLLADAPDPRGGSWAPDGTILFVPAATTVHRISASTGPSVEVTHLDIGRHELIHGWPSFLPDGKHFLLWVFSSERQNEGIHLGTLDSGELRLFLPVRSRAQYAKGYLFFGRQRNLMAQRFDPETLQLSGDATRVAEGLGLSSGEFANMAFSVSNTGGIAWWEETIFGKAQPTWFDRAGHVAGILGEPGNYWGLMPSPDGKYIATEIRDLLALTTNILLLDLAGRNPSRLTFVNYAAGNPVWSADSQRVLFTQWTDQFDVVSLHGGAAQQIPFPGGTNADYPLSWSPDGQTLLFERSASETRLDLWVLAMSGNQKPRPFLNTQMNEFDGRISPDGHWVAYVTDESGRNEVFVQSFPVPGSKRRISTDGGWGPMWRSDGRELYFVTPDYTLSTVSVTPGANSIEFSSPMRLFQPMASPRGAGRSIYAPSADGQRFLVAVPVEDDLPKGIHLLRNWRP